MPLTCHRYVSGSPDFSQEELMYWIGCSHGDGGVTPPRPGQTQFLSRRQRPTRPIHAASPWLNSHPRSCEKEDAIGEACAESGVAHKMLLARTSPES